MDFLDISLSFDHFKNVDTPGSINIYG